MIKCKKRQNTVQCYREECVCSGVDADTYFLSNEGEFNNMTVFCCRNFIFLISLPRFSTCCLSISHFSSVHV